MYSFHDKIKNVIEALLAIILFVIIVIMAGMAVEIWQGVFAP